MAVFYIKQNDTSPSVLYALEPTTVNLTGAAVRLKMRSIWEDSFDFDKAAVVVTETGTPTVRYDWQSGDTATTGFYVAQFVVTYSDDTVETFPNYTPLFVVIS